jgi:hypothetical protein
LTAHIFDNRGAEREVALGAVDPLHAMRLDQTIQASPQAVRVVLHVNNERGSDAGALAEAGVTRARTDS